MEGYLEQSNTMKFQSCLKNLLESRTDMEYVICCQQSCLSFAKRCPEFYIIVKYCSKKRYLN